MELSLLLYDVEVLVVVLLLKANLFYLFNEANARTVENRHFRTVYFNQAVIHS